MSVDIQVNMVSAVTEAVKLKKENPRMDNERIMQQVSKMAQKVKGDASKIGMIAAASKALSIMDREIGLKEKEYIKRTVAEFSNILGNM